MKNINSGPVDGDEIQQVTPHLPQLIEYSCVCVCVCVLTEVFVCQVSLSELSHFQLETLLGHLRTAATGKPTWVSQSRFNIFSYFFKLFSLTKPNNHNHANRSHDASYQSPTEYKNAPVA